MAIFILEDYKVQAAHLEKIICEYYLLQGNGAEKIVTSSNTTELLTNAEKSLEFNLYFLDLQIGKMLQSGVAVAKSIRTFDEHGIIVFVTSHSELALAAYRSQVTAYTLIEKSLNADEFTRMVFDSLRLYDKNRFFNENSDVFILETGIATLKLNFEDIFYFCTANEHRIKISARGFSKTFRGKLSDIEKQDRRLIRVHQSFLVNLQNLKIFDRKEHNIVFPDGEKINISRKYYQDVLKSIAKVLNRTP